jgi:hypothetical protein
MKKNLGNIDRVIRILFALVVVILAVTKVISGTGAIVLLILGAILLITSLINFCPIYLALGINTGKKKE